MSANTKIALVIARKIVVTAAVVGTVVYVIRKIDSSDAVEETA